MSSSDKSLSIEDLVEKQYREQIRAEVYLELAEEYEEFLTLSQKRLERLIELGKVPMTDDESMVFIRDSAKAAGIHNVYKTEAARFRRISENATSSSEAARIHPRTPS